MPLARKTFLYPLVYQVSAKKALPREPEERMVDFDGRKSGAYFV
jgi:hypothetical protein